MNKYTTGILATSMVANLAVSAQETPQESIKNITTQALDEAYRQQQLRFSPDTNYLPLVGQYFPHMKDAFTQMDAAFEDKETRKKFYEIFSRHVQKYSQAPEKQIFLFLLAMEEVTRISDSFLNSHWERIADDALLYDILYKICDEYIARGRPYIKEKNKQLIKIQKAISVIIKQQASIDQENKRIEHEKRDLDSYFKHREGSATTAYEKEEIQYAKEWMSSLYKKCEEENKNVQAENKQDILQTLQSIESIFKDALGSKKTLEEIEKELTPILIRAGFLGKF